MCKVVFQHEGQFQKGAATLGNAGVLVERSDLFDQVLSSIADFVYTFDREGRFTFINKPLLDLWGMTLNEAVGRNFFELPYPEDLAAKLLSQIQHVVDTGEKVVDETPYESPTGSQGFYQYIFSPIFEEDGSVRAVAGTTRDITDHHRLRVERERAVADLEESRKSTERQRRLYEAILSNTPDLAYVFDLNHRFTYANEVLLQMWGKTAEEAIGKNCLELGYEPWHAAMHDREIEQVVRTKQPIRGEVPFHGTFGLRMYDYIFVPVLGANGEVEAVAGTTRDITDRVAMESKLAEQAEQLANESRRKDEFLAMLSHELRNPLAPISSAVHLLKLQKGHDENSLQQQAREIIERQVANLTKIVNDLLEVSRVVSGRIRLDLQVVDLNNILELAGETAKPLIDQRQHTFQLTLCETPLWASVDPTRLEEVFVNLLNNAAKYTASGGSIQVFCEKVPGEDKARIRVRDNGMGIEEKLQPLIFDLFTQADRSLDRSAGGLGIGLSLAHKLVDLHGGTIEVHSPPMGEERGSEFIVQLPLTQNLDLPAKPTGQDEQGSGGDGLRILLVDDNVDLVMMLSSSLRHKGHIVQSAYNGPDGCKVAQQWRPDVVILDIGLPGLDGYQVAAKLRADQALNNVGLIALTGYGRDSDVMLSKEAGFDAHVTKPYNLDELEKLVQTWKRRESVS